MRQFWVGGILLSTALSSPAITLGIQTGAGVLGRPLDIRVQAILAPGEAQADICVSAEVLYGESQLAPGAVKATLQRTTPDAQASVRVQTSVAIDEPVVTVLLRAGCTAPFTRRYVLLVDPVRDSAETPTLASAGGAPAPLRSPNAGQLPTVSAVGGAVQPSGISNARATNVGSAALGATEAPRAAPQSPAAAPNNQTRRVVRKPAAAPPSPPAAPRLELEPIDLSLAIERDPVLKLSLSLLSEPASSPEAQEARAAAGLLWKAINASPEDILRDNTRLQALSDEVGALRNAQASSQADISELTSRLAAARQWQWLIYVLGALLALALVALLWLWRQQKSRASAADNTAWWSPKKALHADARNSAPRRESAKSASVVHRDRTPEPHASNSKLHPLLRSPEPNDSRLLDLGDSTPAPLAPAHSDFAPSQSASRLVATEELFDIQQQADFFISLGEDEQAIKLLRDHIAESHVPSPLTYLDLLKIYHRQGRQDEYEQLRTDFNRLFNAGAPAFAQFSDVGRGLEFYERALGRIQALWPEPRVLDVIEQSIFREASDPQSEVFDLEAYRELLLLHALAKDMIQREAVDSKLPKDFAHTKVQALKATAPRGAPPLDGSAVGADAWPLEQRPRISPNLGLDVNLDDLLAPSAFDASLPNLDLPVGPADDAARVEAIPGEKANTLDFEMLDFTPPDEGVPPAKQTDKRR